MIVYPKVLDSSNMFLLSQIAALAARETYEFFSDKDILVKWPNDILVGTEKVAGILAQAAPADSTGKIPFVVVGIGFNVGWAPPGATSLSASGWTTPLTPHEFLLQMLPEIDRMLLLDDDAMHAEYLSRLATVGSQVKVEMPNGSFIEGRALSVEPDGRLVVLDECAVTHRIDTADVVHLRPGS
jgi:BirA family biotin operon repressor/biotin-[acetyl-CoA-carboxylase] ligase